jgi:hypothetical protein
MQFKGIELVIGNREANNYYIKKIMCIRAGIEILEALQCRISLEFCFSTPSSFSK